MSAHSLMRWFQFGHLPPHLQDIAVKVADCAEEINSLLVQESAEKTAGLRKLLEAKDNFVRAAIEQHERSLG
jgi:hypothetical protein